jgi:hypothetical protein
MNYLLLALNVCGLLIPLGVPEIDIFSPNIGVGIFPKTLVC